MIILISSFVTLQLLDVLTTMFFLANGYEEGNPLYYALGPPLFFLGKGLTVLYCILAVKFLPNWGHLREMKMAMMWLLVVASFIVVVWNLNVGLL